MGRAKAQARRAMAARLGAKGDKDAKPNTDKGKAKRPGRRQLCVHFIYSKCKAKEWIYRHAHHETPEEKEHYKAVYKTISSRPRALTRRRKKNLQSAATGKQATALTGRAASSLARIRRPLPPRLPTGGRRKAELPARAPSAASAVSARNRECPIRRPRPPTSASRRD